jgi:ribonuclease BN (tRNA processing enzyme)
MTMRLLALGVGDAFSARHFSTAFCVEAAGRWLLIDCPHPIRKMLAEASLKAGIPLDLDAVEGVVLTHLHGDHASGLESFGYFNRFALGRRAQLLAHPLVSHRLWEGHLAAGMEHLLPSAEAEPVEMGLPDYFELSSLDEKAPVPFGPFTIECRRTIHHIPTTALRIHAGGRTIAYSADTTFDTSLIDWLAPADLILHETGYGVHTPYSALESLPLPLRAKMRLVHYPDELEATGDPRPLTEGDLLTV